MAKNKDPDMPIVDALADFLMGRCSEEGYIRRVIDARGCIPECAQQVLDVVHGKPYESDRLLGRECVGAGWWPIIDACLSQILAIDPEAQIEVKEKFGTLRIWVGSESVEDCRVFDPFIEAAEEASKTVCEICGSPGRLRKRRWIQTLCDRCAGK